MVGDMTASDGEPTPIRPTTLTDYWRMPEEMLGGRAQRVNRGAGGMTTVADELDLPPTLDVLRRVLGSFATQGARYSQFGVS